MTTANLRVLADGFTMLESGRWHDGRLWVAHWGSREILALDTEGHVERMGPGPEGYGWSFDWLPDGRLLTTGATLTVSGPAGTGQPYGHLADVATHGWNELVVTAGGDVYVNGFEFDLAGGGAPQPGVVALVAADGTTRVVAKDLQFPNGMAIAPDGATLLVSESFAGRITAFDIAPDGGLGDRRVWADGVAPDGICIDAEGAVWCGAPDIQMLGGGPDAPGGALLRIREGGQIVERVEFDQPAFSCVLGGPEGRTLFALTTQWRGFDRITQTAAERTGKVLATDVTTSGVLAVGALAVGGLAACGSPQAQAGLVGYRAPAGTEQLVLVVETGPNDTLLDGKVLSEDAEAVTVEVPMRRAEDDQPAQAVQHDVTVTLAKPLGARKVLATSGNQIPQLTP